MFRSSLVKLVRFTRFSRNITQYVESELFNVIPNQINTNDELFKENRQIMDNFIKTYKERLSTVNNSGNQKTKDRHISRGKLLPRERINYLLDPGSHFMELSHFAGYNQYGMSIPSGGIITGIGLISKKLCMVIANDSTVKGGTYFPITVKKHIRAQMIALENKLPCIYLVDSGGAYLPLQADIFPDENHFGRIFYNQSMLSANHIPQIAVVLGSCTAGGAYIPALSDQTIMINKKSNIFLGGPPLVLAATGEVVTAEELGGAMVHNKISGLSDYMTNTEEEALKLTRNMINDIPYKTNNIYMNNQNIKYNEPLYSINDLNGFISNNYNNCYDIKQLLNRILDDSIFNEYKKYYGQTLVTGFGRIHGHLVGLICNNGILYSQSSDKGTNFVEICCNRQIPIIFIQNISGFMVGKKSEYDGIGRAGSKLVMAVSNAKVPKITLIIGGSFGAGNYAMCGRAFNPRFLYIWPNSKISVMGGDQAASVLSQVNSGANIDEIKQQYQTESDCYYSSSRLWDDGIILPEDTRNVLGLSLDICSNNMNNQTEFGIFRI